MPEHGFIPNVRCTCGWAELSKRFGKLPFEEVLNLPSGMQRKVFLQPTVGRQPARDHTGVTIN